MKTKMILFLICTFLISVAVSAKIKDGQALTGNSSTEFGKYSVVNSDNPMVINGETIKTYDLTYENTNQLVQIGVIREKSCTSFILRSESFEIEYMCNKGVFGVRKIERKYQEIPTEANEAKLNRAGYYSQRVICTNPKTEDELLGLIACYFPNLINEDYHASF